MIIVVGVTGGQETGQSRTTLKVLDILNHEFKKQIYHIEQPFCLSLSKFIIYYIRILYFLLLQKDIQIYISISRTVKSFYARDLIVLLSAIFKRHRCIVHLVGNDFEDFCNRSHFARKIYRKLLTQKQNTFIVLSERMRRKSIEFFRLGDDNAQVELLPGFVELNVNIQDLRSSKSRGIDDRVTIGFMSNLIPEKGIFDFLDAITLLFTKSDASLYSVWIAGRRQPKVNYAQLDDLVSKDVVQYYDFIRGSKKSELLTKTDIFILPTYYVTEALPLSLVEAAAHGALVVSCATGDVEVITKIAKGRIVAPKDPIAILNCIEEFNQSCEFNPVDVSMAVCSHFSVASYKIKLLEIFTRNSDLTYY